MAELKSFNGVTVVLAVLCVVMLIALGYEYQKRYSQKTMSEYSGDGGAPPSADSAQAQNNILVHVKGAVNSPGLYTLAQGSRAVDAINAAGGLTDSAAADGINLAEKLADGEEVYVPSANEAAVSRPVSSAKKIKIINLNSASSEELQTLPGIGPSYADRIIGFRKENGPFGRIEEIMKVKGISKAKFEKLRAYITV